MAKKVTYQKISELTGLSISTISRVINNKEIVNPDTYERVQAAIRQLGYTHDTAPGPSSSRPKVIVFNLPNLENPFYPGILRGMKDYARLHGLEILIDEGLINEQSFRYYQRLLKEPLICGMITSWDIDEKYLNELNQIVPIIQCAEYNPRADAPYVGFDDEESTRILVNHLLSQGRRSISIIKGPIGARFAEERFQTCLRIARELNVEINEKWIVPMSINDFNMTLTTFTSIFSQPEHPNAVIANYDTTGAAVIKAALRCGLNVPRDVMVTGFDNLPISYMISPTLTTIAPPTWQLGYVATELIYSKIKHPQNEVQSLSLSAELIVRESTSPEK